MPAIILCLSSFPLGAGGLWSALSPPAFKVLHDILNSVSHILKSFLGVHDCRSSIFKSFTDVFQEFFERGIVLPAPVLASLDISLGFFIPFHPAVAVALDPFTITVIVVLINVEALG